MEQHTDYRYPGSRPFYDTDLDRRLFFGRNHEKQSLLHMVLAERLVVLFAKSGIGKTSLINAGLIQQLRKRDYVSIKIRLNDPKEDPVQTLLARIKEEPSATVEDKLGEAKNLWQFFKTVEFWSTEDTLMTPVLILDQFEELFTLHSAEHRRHFISQLADLVRERPPKELAEQTTAEQKPPYSESPPDLKIIIAIREDFLAQLEELADEIPAILQNRFRLLPLDRNQARMAIEEPAQLEDAHLDTARFEYAPETVEAMLDFLCKRKDQVENIVSDEVEPFQLQLLCQYIENKVRRLQGKESSGVIIHKQDLGGKEEMRQVLKHFYNNQINRLKPGWKKKNVRNLCEKGLISETERRLSLEEEEIERKYRVPKIILGELVNNRLLRSEPRVGSVYYELSHDTLVNSIRKAQIERKKRNARVLSSVLLIGLFILIGAFFYFGGPKLYTDFTIEFKYREAKNLRNKGKIDQAIAKYKEILKMNLVQSSAYEELANIYLEKGNLEEAKVLLIEATKNEKVQNATIYHLLGKVYDKQGLPDTAKDMYEKSIEMAPSFSRAHTDLARVYDKKKETDKAIHHYETALDKGDSNAYTYKELAKLYVKQSKIESAVKNYRKAMEVEGKSGGRNIYTYKALAKLYERQGKIEAAIKNYLEVKNIGDKSPETYRRLATLYIKNGDFDEATEFYKEALNENPATLFIYSSLARELKRAKADETANEIYQIAFNEYLKSKDINRKNAEAYRHLAYYYINEKNFEGAIEGYRYILALHPEYAYIHVDLVSLIKNIRADQETKQANKTRAYEIAFDAYLNSDKDDISRKNAEAYRRLAYDYIENDKIEQAIKGYKHILALRPEYAYIQVDLAKALKRKNADRDLAVVYAVASTAYERLLAEDDKNTLTVKILASLYIEQGKFDKAVKVYEKHVSATSRNAYIYADLVISLKNKNAEKQVDRIYEIATTAYEKLQQTPDKKSRTHYRSLANLYVKQNQFDKAIDIYKQAIAAGSGNANLYRGLVSELIKEKANDRVDQVYNLASEVKNQNANYYLDLGNELSNRQKFDIALINYQKAIKANPKDASAYLRMGIAQLYLRKYDLSIESYKKTLENDEKSEAAYNAVSVALAKKGRYWEAIEYLHKGLALKSRNKIYRAQANNNMGFALNKLGINYRKAIEYLREAEKLKEKQINIFVYSNLGYAYTELKNFEAAQKSLNEALKFINTEVGKRSPYAASPYKNIGRLYYERGNLPEAIKFLKDAKKRGPNFTDTYYSLGLAYLKNGQRHKVTQLFQEAIKRDPENIDFKRQYIEVFFSSERYEQAYEIAQEILKEKQLSKEMHLLMRVASISALLFQGKRAEAAGELETFFADFKALNKNNKPFQIGVKWKYVVIENKINPKAVLSEKDQNLILALIDIIESPIKEANKKFTNLEAAFSQLKKG